jgi:hypothetical protein
MVAPEIHVEFRLFARINRPVNIIGHFILAFRRWPAHPASGFGQGLSPYLFPLTPIKAPRVESQRLTYDSVHRRYRGFNNHRGWLYGYINQRWLIIAACYCHAADWQDSRQIAGHIHYCLFPGGPKGKALFIHIDSGMYQCWQLAGLLTIKRSLSPFISIPPALVFLDLQLPTRFQRAPVFRNLVYLCRFSIVSLQHLDRRYSPLHRPRQKLVFLFLRTAL